MIEKRSFIEINNYLLLQSKQHYGCCEIENFINKNSGDIDESFLGFVTFYYNISEFIDKKSIILDFGCGPGLQHLFFKDFIGYIGIDHNEWFRPMSKTKNTDNFVFLKEEIEDFLDPILKLNDSSKIEEHLLEILSNGTKNTMFKKYIEEKIHKLDDAEIFSFLGEFKIVALCNKVPSKQSREKINSVFLNVFNYY